MAKTSEVKNNVAAPATVDRAGYEFGEKEQISFPPYWKPAIGKSFVAMPLFRDERDPKFVRYHLTAFEDMDDCLSGPTEDATAAPVKKGETFTLGQYKALPLDFFMGLPDPVLITCEKTVPSQHPNDTFIWSIRPTKRCKEIVAARRLDPNNVLPPGMTRPALTQSASAK